MPETLSERRQVRLRFGWNYYANPNERVRPVGLDHRYVGLATVGYDRGRTVETKMFERRAFKTYWCTHCGVVIAAGVHHWWSVDGAYRVHWQCGEDAQPKEWRPWTP